MSRLLVVIAMAGWIGMTLLLSELRWFARARMVERLRPYAPGGMGRSGRSGVFSVESFKEAVGPLSRAVGERVSRLAGVSEDLETRLARVHSSLDPTSFRVRQVGYSLAGLGVGAFLALATGPPPLVGAALVITGPALAFLVQEQRIALRSERWKKRLFQELPVVCEQLSLLLAAGWSLSSAMNRLASRGSGCCAADLSRVCLRIRHGLSEAEALAEWAAVAQVVAVERLVSVLALNRETSDLGRLIAEEARSARRDVQRHLIEAVERRDQQVWIPVTVATLVPGVIFMAIPFIDALSFFGT